MNLTVSLQVTSVNGIKSVEDMSVKTTIMVSVSFFAKTCTLGKLAQACLISQVKQCFAEFFCFNANKTIMTYKL